MLRRVAFMFKCRFIHLHLRGTTARFGGKSIPFLSHEFQPIGRIAHDTVDAALRQRREHTHAVACVKHHPTIKESAHRHGHTFFPISRNHTCLKASFCSRKYRL